MAAFSADLLEPGRLATTGSGVDETVSLGEEFAEALAGDLTEGVAEDLDVDFMLDLRRAASGALIQPSTSETISSRTGNSMGFARTFHRCMRIVAHSRWGSNAASARLG